MKYLQKAFTLIELLVVIAIIGILASVILASLNDARDQGIQAKLKTEMDSLAKRAAIEHSKGGSYDIVCGSNLATQSPEIIALIASIDTLASTTVVCNSEADAYAASVGLESTHWCVDSIGSKSEIPDALTTSPKQLVCP